MNKLNLIDIKNAIWDKRFRDLFQEYEEQFKEFFKNPGCGCNTKFLRTLAQEKERLQQYFPTKDVVLEEPKPLDNDYVVINCLVQELDDKIRQFPKGKRLVAAARFKDRITVVLNDAVANFQLPDKNITEQVKEVTEQPLNWRVINTTTSGLQDALRGLPKGRKIISISRFRDQITLIANDLNAIF